ncbi:MAG TPA: RNA polymerase sigma factor [Vicinamibacterales bacterium]|nr:RNA polymerase sigma factor [Vicinamibacterales bacterium]
MDDAALLAKARRGNEDAFSLLFERHQRQIYRYGAYMCGPHAADDVVQDTFLAVLRQTGRSDTPGGSVRSYLLGIARHIALKRLAAAHTPLEEPADEANDELASADPSPLETMTRSEMSGAVRRAVETLPAAYREAVVLCELQQLEYEEAAGLMQCPIGTVRSRLHRARRLLAAKLGSAL